MPMLRDFDNECWSTRIKRGLCLGSHRGYVINAGRAFSFGLRNHVVHTHLIDIWF